MKKWLGFFIFLISFTSSVFAATNKYIIIIDAGSSGSRAHLFEYAKSVPMIPIPVIKDLFSSNTRPGLSSFVNNPSAAGASLKPILDASLQKLQTLGVSPSQVPVEVLATAGMRLLTPAQQEAIYASVRSYIHSHYAFQLNDAEVKTITGQMEGVFDWLDVNYLMNNFLNPPMTVGAIDMGGASTQIAFATNNTSFPQNEVTLTINRTRYTVFSQSFLGLGQDQARTTMNTDAGSASCYPSGYVFSGGTGNYDFAGCASIYANIIQSHQVAQNIVPVSGQFVAFSGIYFTYHFFQILNTPSQVALQSQIQNICYQTWAQLLAQYGNDPFLPNYCANGTYFNDLLYNTYGLQGSQLIVKNQINGTGIDWTLGALLYSLVQ